MGQADVLDLFLIVVTMISTRFCQWVRFASVDRWRVISIDLTVRTSISAHVNTMVPLSLTKPYCQ